MPQEIELPNGHVLEFPDGMSQMQMQQAIQKNYPQFAPKKVRQGKESIPKEFLAGALNIGNILGQNLNQFAQEISPEMYSKLPKTKQIDFRAEFGLPEQQSTLGYVAGEAPQFLASMALPEAKVAGLASKLRLAPKIGTYLEKAIANAIPQSVYSAALSPENPMGQAVLTAGTVAPFAALGQATQSASPFTRGAARLGSAALGAGAGYAGAQSAGQSDYVTDLAAALGAALGYHGLNPARNAQESMLKGVSPGTFEPQLEAAKRLGIEYLSPGEATGNPFISARNATAGRTAEGAQKLHEMSEKRQETVGKSIEDLLKNVYAPEKHKEVKEALYKSSSQTKVPNDFIESLQQNEIVKKAEKIVGGNPVFKESLKDTPKDSIAYWDHIKQAMDDMIEKAPKKQASIISDTKKKLVEKLDEIEPNYKEARALAEREITRKKIEKAFDKKELTAANMYNILKSKTNYDKLQHSLRNAPEAQKQLEDMKLVFKNLIGPQTAKTAAALERANMNKARNTNQSLKEDFMAKITSGKYDKAAVELITNPNWAEKLQEMKKATSKEKTAGKFINLLGKVASQIEIESNKENK